MLKCREGENITLVFQYGPKAQTETEYNEEDFLVFFIEMLKICYREKSSLLFRFLVMGMGNRIKS